MEIGQFLGERGGEMPIIAIIACLDWEKSAVDVGDARRAMTRGVS